MKTFLKKIITFTFLFITPLLIYIGWLLADEVFAYWRALSVPGGTTIVAAQDSQMQLALDPAIFPSFYNNCSAGCKWQTMFLRIRQMIQKNPQQIKYWIIDLSGILMGEAHDAKATVNSVFAIPQYTVACLSGDCEHWEPFNSKTIGMFRDYAFDYQFKVLRRMLKGKQNLEHQFGRGHIASQARLQTKGTKSTKNQFDKLLALWPQIYSYDKCKPFYHELQCLADQIHKDGGRIIFLITPWSNVLRLNLTPDQRLAHQFFVDDIRKLMPNVPCFDYFDCTFIDELWGDANHLNTWGSQKFTRTFVKDFESWRSKEMCQ